MSKTCIQLKQVRENNLKGIDLDIPLGKITVITGPSGAGKSTLAMDVLYSEGHYRYLESLSPAVKAVIGLRPRPEATTIKGLPPPIALGQTLPRQSRRSIVATLTDLSGPLRQLFASCGLIHCPSCGTRLEALTVDQMADQVLDLPEGTRLHILAPVRSGENLEATLGQLQARGFSRVRLDGAVMLVEDIPPGQPGPSSLEVVIDRIVTRPGILSRLTDSLSLALRTGDGHAMVEILGKGKEDGRVLYFSDRLSCQRCDISLPEPTPGMFSTHEMNLEDRDSSFMTLARSITILNHDFYSTLDLSLEGFRSLLEEVKTRAQDPACQELRNPRAGEPLAQIILARLLRLLDMGLGYMELGRPLSEVSTGELQKLRLAAHLARELTGVLYILDEPTIGLHPSEQRMVLQLIKELRDLGNTLILVEHRLAWIMEAEHIIELGPGSGREGGYLLYSGPPGQLARCDSSVTGPYLSGERKVTRQKRAPGRGRDLRIDVRPLNNLQRTTINIPQGVLSCLVGPSGSGKTSLLQNISAFFSDSALGITTTMVDQAPVSSAGYSNPATYIGIFTRIRSLFSRVPQARARGYGAGHFSLAKKGGRCEACKGRGYTLLDLKYLPPMQMPCDLCGGKRYNREALNIRYKGLNLHEVLELTVSEALRFFSKVPSIRIPLEILDRTGLGYLKLGQPTDSLSGGENQRLKLAKALGSDQSAPCIYLLDEPTKGLHPSDVQRLLVLVDELLDAEHTVVISTNCMELVAVSDWIIELGPGGGPEGGRVLFSGPPEDLLKQEGSLTAPFLVKPGEIP